MDRRQRSWIIRGGLGLLLAASGCRGMRNEVPPPPPFNPDGTGAMPGVGFSGGVPQAALGAVPGTTAPNASPYGAPGASMAGYGAPTGNSYGAPGTAGMADAHGAASPATAMGGAAAGYAPATDPGTVPSGYDPAVSASAPTGGLGTMGNPAGGPSPF